MAMWSALELKVSPVLLTLLFAGVMWWLAQVLPNVNLTVNERALLCLPFLTVAAGIGLSAVWSFRSARTSVNPFRPHHASRLVRTGIYRHSRNPMYLALLFALLGWGCLLANVFSLALSAGYVAYLNRFQIEPEERALLTAFGEEFTAYCRKVRRWL
jgi:protein-S-isoprenylcysteine O-methyltransferase Ste14